MPNGRFENEYQNIKSQKDKNKNHFPLVKEKLPLIWTKTHMVIDEKHILPEPHWTLDISKFSFSSGVDKLILAWLTRQI